MQREPWENQVGKGSGLTTGEQGIELQVIPGIEQSDKLYVSNGGKLCKEHYQGPFYGQ
jgi:hypothetical protein